jgi:DNA polymerase III sliding clamp (beta) subunit (PCNA family)
MQIKTKILKTMLSKAMRAVVNNKMLPLTGLISISTFTDGYIQLVTYDGNNFLSVVQDIGSTEDYYVVVEATSFNNLINKLTEDVVTLTNKDRYLEVTCGKSRYKFDIAWEDEDRMVEFPIPQVDINDFIEVPLKDLMVVWTKNKPSSADTYERPELTGAYFGDKIITTNGSLACITNLKPFKTPILFNYSTLKLLQSMEGNTLRVGIKDNYVCITDEISTILGNLMKEVDCYPARQILEFLSLDFPFTVQLNRTDILSALERLNIFVKEYEKNIISMVISDNLLVLKSLSNNAEDVIELNSTYDYYACNVDFTFLKQQISSCSADVVNIKFGRDVVMLIEEELTTYVIALAVED